MKKILLLEDDKNLREPLARYLSEQGYEVLQAESIEAAKPQLTNIDLAIFDWHLPDGEGIDLLKQMRNDGLSIPIIMLTARKDVIDKVLGLELGADDYMIKPYEPRELVARIKLQLRKNSNNSNELSNISFDGIEINNNLREVKVDNKVIELTKLEYDLLFFLSKSPNKVFTRNELLDEIWGVNEMSETRAVDNHIFQLRKKLNRDIFKTIRGVGYRLCIEQE